MTVSRDVNLGTLLPIALFLIVQTGGGIWWASSIHAAVDQLAREQSKLIIESDDENLRQWSRINNIEDTAEITASAVRTTAALMERIERDVSATRTEIQKTNALIRDMFIKQAEQNGRLESGKK